MGDRGRQLSHYCDAVRVSQLRLGALSLRQVDDEADALALDFAEDRRTQKHGNAAAVFAKELFLGRFPGALAAADNAKPALSTVAGQIQVLDYFYYTALAVTALY